MKNLTEGNIYKNFILFSIPMVLAAIFSQGYSIINTIIAGQLIGDKALAAIGSLSPLSALVNSAFTGYATGVGIFVGQLFGAKDFEKMKRVIIVNLELICIAVAIISLLMFVFRYPIYEFLNVDKNIIDECNRYFIIITLGKIFILFSASFTYLHNAMGDGTFPLIASLTSSFLNIVLGIFGVTVLDMGVAGLAFASVTSAAIVGIMHVIRISSGFKKLDVRGVLVPFDFSIVKRTFGFSFFTMIQQSIMSFTNFFISPMINSIGSVASASFTVNTQICAFGSVVYQNSAKTVGSYTAQCYGAKKYDKLQKGLVIGFIQNMIYILPILAVCSIFAENVAMVFFSEDASPISINYTITYLRYCIPLLAFNVVANLFHHFFRGVADMKALVITTAVGSFSGLLIGWALIGPFGLYGYYIGTVMSWFLDGAAGVILYLFGSWKKRLP